jgi:hypothetical protein
VRWKRKRWFGWEEGAGGRTLWGGSFGGGRFGNGGKQSRSL